MKRSIVSALMVIIACTASARERRSDEREPWRDMCPRQQGLIYEARYPDASFVHVAMRLGDMCDKYSCVSSVTLTFGGCPPEGFCLARYGRDNMIGFFLIGQEWCGGQPHLIVHDNTGR